MTTAEHLLLRFQISNWKAEVRAGRLHLTDAEGVAIPDDQMDRWFRRYEAELVVLLRPTQPRQGDIRKDVADLLKRIFGRKGGKP